MSLRPLEMKIELTVIEDLGIKLYGKLPPVISELIANSWDADSKIVNVSLPNGNIDTSSQIIIEDLGIGMTYDEIIDKFLRIGRKRREEGDSSTSGGRRVMGRKGIGKLAVFGVCKTVEIETVKNHVLNSFSMNIEDILNEARSTGVYKPNSIEVNKESEKDL